FENEVVRRAGDPAARHHARGELAIAFHDVLAAPTIEAKPRRRDLVVTRDEDRAGVAQPDVTIGRVVKRHRVRGRTEQRARRGFVLRVAHEQLDALAAAAIDDRGAHRHQCSAGRLESLRPLFGIVGPSGPHRRMWAPFRWHHESIGGALSRHDSACLTRFLWMNSNPEQAFCLAEAFGLDLCLSNPSILHGSRWHRASTRVRAMKTLINAILIGSLMTTV